MQRIPQWQSKLSAYLLGCYGRPFQYGVMDCGLLVAGAIEAMTGVDVAGELRGYHNRTQAYESIRRVCGCKNMLLICDHIAAEFCCPAIPVAMAQRGDPLQLRSGSLGLVAMHGTELLTPYKDGLLRLPLNQAVRAWRI